MNRMPLRIVFMGTPDFAVPSLHALVEAGFPIVGVITATDKPGGRGGKQVLESAVKQYARGHGLRILQPPNLKDPAFTETLRSLNADLQVVVAFRMLPEVVWNMPPMGTINLHGSLLPAYRGAAPINWAIIKGETQTGVTTFQLRHEIDTGNILMQRALPIGPDDTAGYIHDRMMDLGAQVVLETVRGIERGILEPVPQSDQAASQAPKLRHETCEIQFSQDVHLVHNFIRGLSPYPTAWTTLDGLQLNIYRSVIIDTTSTGKAGTILDSSATLDVACSQGIIRMTEVQLAGKKRMEARDFLNGYQFQSRVLGL